MAKAIATLILPIAAGIVLAGLAVAQSSATLSGHQVRAVVKRSGAGFGPAQPARPDVESIFPLTKKQKKTAYFWDRAGFFLAACMCEEANKVRRQRRTSPLLNTIVLPSVNSLSCG
jgi:hypothetical protein